MCVIIIGIDHDVLPYANDKGADQPAHPRSLISAFVVRCLDSIIPSVSISEISSLYLASVAAQAGLSLPWVPNAKDRFSGDEAHMLSGIELGQKRWDDVFDVAQKHTKDHIWSFTDLNVFITCLGAGQHDLATQMLNGVREYSR